MSLKRIPRGKFGPKTFLGRRVAAIFVLALLSSVLLTGWSLASAVFTPVNDPLSAKVAEWARNHGMGVIVTGLESLQYQLNPPKVGGVPVLGILKAQNSSTPMRLLADLRCKIRCRPSLPRLYAVRANSKLP
jgi:hypothetical protein